MEMQIYIANLDKYNEGELIGDWFSPPIDFDTVKDRIGLNDEYEEYAIHDYELPFSIDEYTSISEINRKCELVTELESYAFFENISSILNYWFNDLEELVEHKDDIICHSDCSNMSDVARNYIEESGTFSDIPNNLKNYIDYQAFGRDLEIEGNFLMTSQGVLEYIA